MNLSKIPKSLYLVLVIPMVIIAAIIFLEMKAPADTKDGNPVITNPTASTSAEPVSRIDTSDWKTYANEKWGYSFKYPKNWYLEEATITITIVRPWERKASEYSDPTRDISIRVLPNDPSELPRYGEGEKKKDIIVGGIEAMEYQLYPSPGAPSNFRVVYVPNGKELYEIKIYQKNPAMDVFYQILDSFTFTK